MSHHLKVFINGRIITMEPGRPDASAMAVAAGRFLAVGTDEQLRPLVQAGAEVVDLGGRTVTPGFIEPHSHISYYAYQQLQVNCSPAASQNIDEIKDRIRKRAGETEPGAWIQGYGYDDTLIEDHRHLNRSDLDEAAPDRPVFIHHISGHLYYANSAALKIGGLTADTPQPEGGEIHKDESGRPSGLLLEPAAAAPIVHRMPQPSPEMYKAAMEKAVDHYHQAGITSCHDAAIGFANLGPDLIQLYRELEAEGRLTVRVYMTILEPFYARIIELGLGPGFGSEHLKLGSVKLFQDGSIQGLTAALRKPYHNRPDYFGDLIMPQENLDAVVEKYVGLGFQMAIHANGDRAIESILLAMERADRIHPGRRDLRHMIIHCQTASDDQIRRMKELGIIPNYFVNHVYYWGDRHESLFLGPQRARRIDPLKSTLDMGLRFVLHSDLPVTPVDPIFSMHTAVNRLTRQGAVLGPEQRIGAYEALRAYTVDAAHCSFEEDSKGSVAHGKLADFTVLSDNILTSAPERIKDIRVEATVVGGKTVFGDL
ncbi:MAG: amidohydrolase [Proteobacteria bacterium]|nr:amidohydrolase [Pseudomonadota bacterium]